MVVCGLCGNVIEEKDKLALSVTIQNWKSPEFGAPSQHIFVHAECLLKQLDPEVPFMPEMLLPEGE